MIKMRLKGKVTVLILACLVSIGAVGCGDKENNDTTKNKAEKSITDGQENSTDTAPDVTSDSK
ncbi:TPA: peptide ABC transporter substrate-binding protein [Clostridioides difficile]|nr:peptide ABC transporter substrate-binding protein [Clostridioides difficile]